MKVSCSSISCYHLRFSKVCMFLFCCIYSSTLQRMLSLNAHFQFLDKSHTVVIWRLLCFRVFMPTFIGLLTWRLPLRSVTDKKTEISLLTLPFLLVPTARRGVKKARLSRKKAVDMFFQDLPVSRAQFVILKVVLDKVTLLLRGYFLIIQLKTRNVHKQF